MSDTEEHFVFTPENGDDSHQKVQTFNSEGFQLGSNNSANNSNGTNGSSRQGFQQRNTWLRSSLRRSGYGFHFNYQILIYCKIKSKFRESFAKNSVFCLKKPLFIITSHYYIRFEVFRF